jgi:AcrR family transcriptional regulator
MEEIAQRAGVGVGTLYRRFPDRDTLIHAVAADAIQQLAETARTAWAEEPDAWSALSRFLHRSCAFRLGALQSMLDAPLHDAIRANPALQHTREALAALVEKMTERAQAEGTLRRDIGPADIAVLITLQVHPLPHLPADAALDRCMRLMLDGLRTRSD